MIDTIDVVLDVNDFKYTKIKAGVNRFIKKRDIPGHVKLLHPPTNKRGGAKLVTSGFTDLGIQEFALCHDQYLLNEGTADVIYRYYVRMTIKPANFLYPNNPYALSKFEDLDRTEHEINRFIKDLNRNIGYELLPPVMGWRVNRIDYAYQFRDSQYPAYLLLFKKERPKLDSKVYYPVSGAELIPAEVRYWNRNINFHVYDKTLELWEKHDYFDRKAAGGRHMLRFEIQCKGRCLSSIVHKYQLGKGSIRNLWNQKIADMKIHNAIKKIIGTDDFYNLSSAREILSQHFIDRKVMDMVDFIRPGAYPNTKGNKLPALYAKRFGLDETHVKNNFLPSFHKAGVNIRILPDAWGIDHLVNPVKILGLDN